jgi:hypothetical protein
MVKFIQPEKTVFKKYFFFRLFPKGACCIHSAMQFVPSCSRCLRRISDGQGSVLSCSHFVCDPCAYQPTKVRA